jgi:hypothetical protein
MRERERERERETWTKAGTCNTPRPSMLSNKNLIPLAGLPKTEAELGCTSPQDRSP